MNPMFNQIEEDWREDLERRADQYAKDRGFNWPLLGSLILCGLVWWAVIHFGAKFIGGMFQ